MKVKRVNTYKVLKTVPSVKEEIQRQFYILIRVTVEGADYSCQSLAYSVGIHKHSRRINEDFKFCAREPHRDSGLTQMKG